MHLPKSRVGESCVYCQEKYLVCLRHGGVEEELGWVGVLAHAPCFWLLSEPLLSPCERPRSWGNVFFSLCCFFSWDWRMELVMETRTKPDILLSSHQTPTFAAGD